MIKDGCGRKDCSASTGVHDDESSKLSGLTFGRGELDEYGYWEEPCEKCARAFERLHPEAHPCWPFPQEWVEKHIGEADEFFIDKFGFLPIGPPIGPKKEDER